MEEICGNSPSESNPEEQVLVVEPEVSCLTAGEPEAVVREDLKKLKEFESRILQLENELSKKTDVVSELEKQKGSLEKEVTNVSCYST